MMSLLNVTVVASRFLATEADEAWMELLESNSISEDTVVVMANDDNEMFEVPILEIPWIGLTNTVIKARVKYT